MAHTQRLQGAGAAGAPSSAPNFAPLRQCSSLHRLPARLAPTLPGQAPRRSHAPTVSASAQKAPAAARRDGTGPDASPGPALQAPQAEYAPQYGEQYDPAVYASAPEPPPKMADSARKALSRATRAVKRYGWFSFWVQLTLSVVSGVILLFSVAFTAQVRGDLRPATCPIALPAHLPIADAPAAARRAAPRRRST